MQIKNMKLEGKNAKAYLEKTILELLGLGGCMYSTSVLVSNMYLRCIESLEWKFEACYFIVSIQ